MQAPKPQNKPRELVPAGSHMARVVGIIYLGTVKGSWQGKETESYKIRLTWELPNEMRKFKEDEPEKPMVISKEVGFSMGKKSTLRPIVEGIIGTSLTDEEAYGFDIEKLIGMPCIISVIQEEKGDFGKFSTMKTAAPLMKGTECPPQITETKILSYDSWNQEYFDSLPDFIKDKIKSTPEYNRMQMKNDPNNEFAQLRRANNTKVESTINPDEIPF